MDDRSPNDNRKPNLRRRTGRARGNLMRLERELDRAKENLKSATRNRIVGGAILPIGLIAVLQFSVAIGVVGMFIGGWVFIRARAKVGDERLSVDRITGSVANASAKLAELEAQPSVVD